MDTDPRLLRIPMNDKFAGKTLRPPIPHRSRDGKAANAAAKRDDIFGAEGFGEVLVVFRGEKLKVVLRNRESLLRTWRERFCRSPQGDGAPGNQGVTILVVLLDNQGCDVAGVPAEAEKDALAQKVFVRSNDTELIVDRIGPDAGGIDHESCLH